MKSSSKTSITDEVMTLPKARIDTLEESFILELREFLSTQGCDVVVNNRSVKDCEYHIIVGDRSFVKRIVDTTTFMTKKVLIISWENISFDDFEKNETTLKIALVDPSPLIEKDIKKIFSFFITGKQKILSLKTGKEYVSHGSEKFPSQKEPEKTSNSRENSYPNLPWRTIMNQTSEQQSLSDTARISSVIETLYDDKPKKATAKPVRHSFRSLVLVTGVSTLFLFLLPFFWYGLMTTITGFTLFRFATCLEKGSVSCSKTNLSLARQGNVQRNLACAIVHPIIAMSLGKETVFTYERVGVLFDALIELGKEVDSGVELLSDASAFFSFDGKESKTSAILIDSLKKIMPTIRTNLDLSIGSSALLSTSDIFPFRYPWISTNIEKVTQKMKSYRKIVNMAEQGIALYPIFAGYKGTQKILILLENSSELRPTGGFIGSVARVDVTDGKVSEFQINDVYTFDGQLKGHVDPPQTLKDAWGQEHWYLRDSNWHPDFRESARSALWFFEKETGEKVDVVIAVTTSFLVRMLSVTGPIDLPGYNDRITAENFYAKSLYYTQTDFFPGSTQKKDFLGTLTSALLTKIQSGEQRYALGLARIVTQSLLSRDILLFVSDPEYEEAITNIGWGGNIPSVTSCSNGETKENDSCVVSSVAINEANIGINKVNTFLRREEKRTVTVNETGEITEKIERTITNDSRGEAGSGPYTAYMRFMIPSDVTITGFTIDGIPVPTRDPKKKKQTFPYGELDNSIPGLTTAAVALIIPPSEKRSVAISYKHKNMFSSTNRATVLFTNQKQPGVDEVPSQFSLYFPKNFQVTAFESGVPILAKGGGFEYNNNLTSDTEIRVEIRKNP